MAHMLIEYEDGAYESFQNALSAMEGYGVTIHQGSESFDAILLGPDHDAEDGATIRFIPVVDNCYEVNDYTPNDVRSEVVDRIVVC